MSNPSPENEDLFNQMIHDILSKVPEANRRFYNNLPKISDKIENDEKLQLDLIEFIMMWCDFGDLLAVKTLINNFIFILSSHPSKNAMLSFLPLFREIITKCGSSILSELIKFTSKYKEICGGKFIKKKVFPFISAFIDSDENDVGSCSFSFLTHLIPEIGQENIQKLISISYKLNKLNIPNSRLASIDSFPILVQYFNDDKKKYFNDIISQSLNDAHYLIQTHSIKVASNHIDLITDSKIIMDLSSNPSWKVKLSLLEHIGVFIKAFKEFENVLFQFARNKDEMPILREMAFYEIDLNFENITNINEIFCCVDVALRQKDENMVIAGLKLIPKIYMKNKEITQSLQSLLSRFRTTKKENVQLYLLKYALPYTQVSQNEKEMGKRWLLAGFDSDDWAINDIAIDVIDYLLNCQINLDDFLTDDIFEKVTQMLNNSALNVRNRAAIVYVSYAKNRGWDFTRQKIMPNIRNIANNCSIPIFQSIIRVYIGLKALGPPQDLKKEITSVISKAKEKKEFIYMVRVKENKSK
ncbi:hypothetical protein M9Y10_041476 [Tritrichomonas musculus]|uniref:Uncharacterized protein n=1 Tax=Tritrichomonas musculus TaxID=1915356 RepID=A0ABR2K521_9EUKA